jgi:hypothetical protein
MRWRLGSGRFLGGFLYIRLRIHIRVNEQTCCRELVIEALRRRFNDFISAGRQLRFFFNVLSIGTFYIRVTHTVVPSSQSSAAPVVVINNIEPQIAFAWELEYTATDKPFEWAVMIVGIELA